MIKHAEAGQVRVELVEEAGWLKVSVVDDGSGFDTAQVSPGFGLVGMQDRVGLVGGTLTVESAPGAGATVRAELPARYREGDEIAPRCRLRRRPTWTRWPARRATRTRRRAPPGRGRSAPGGSRRGAGLPPRPRARRAHARARRDAVPGRARASGRRSCSAATRAHRVDATGGWSSPPLTSARMNSGCASGEQQSAQHRAERAGLDRGPQPRRDRLGDRVRLLRRHAALLDRAGGRVTCGVDVGPTVDEPVEVGGNEAVRIVRQAREERSARPRQAHHTLGLDARPRHDASAGRREPRRESGRRGTRSRARPAVPARPRRRQVRRAGAAPAQGLRARARTCAGRARWREPPSSERARRAAAAMRRRAGTAKATRRMRRSSSSTQHGAEAAGIARALDRHAARNRDCGLCSDGDHQDLVGELPAVPGRQPTRVGVDGLDSREMQRGSMVARDLHEVVGLDLAQSERLGDGQRAVRPLRLRRDQLERHALFAPGVAQRDQRFERRDPASDDGDLGLSLLIPTGSGRRAGLPSGDRALFTRCFPARDRLGRVDRFRVVICGGGIAAVEGLLRLRTLAGDALDITLLAPNDELRYRPLAVDEPFAKRGVRRYPLRTIAGRHRHRLAQRRRRVDRPPGSGGAHG